MLSLFFDTEKNTEKKNKNKANSHISLSLYFTQADDIPSGLAIIAMS